MAHPGRRTRDMAVAVLPEDGGEYVDGSAVAPATERTTERTTELGSVARMGPACPRQLWVLSMAIGFSPLAATKFPTGGHHFSPLVAIRSPHPWPSNLPTRNSGRGQVRGLTPLPAVAWASR
jgi:hypothetical protein